MKYIPSKQIYNLIKSYGLLPLIVLMLTANAVSALRVNGRPGFAAAALQRSDKSISATEDVIVSFDIAAAGVPFIMIYGRDQREVRVVGMKGAANEVELRRRDATGAQDAATRVGVTIGEFSDTMIGQESRALDSRAIEVTVPLGASVHLNVRQTNVTIRDVAEASAQSVQGDIAIERVSHFVEVSNVMGRISVKDCRGRVRLRSVSGDVEAINIQATDAGDSLTVNSVSGDMKLERAGYRQIELEAVSGSITFNGVLSPDARLGAKTTSGDISLTLPTDASFRVLASVSLGGFNSDFPLKLTDNSVRKASLRLAGVYGSGSATLDLASHSGSIRIRR